MRFLHTADWHLGQTLFGQSRLEEQARALDWLYDLLIARQVDGLIVAGDIFDVASPAEDARRLYYDFLGRLQASPLRWVVIVAGNHDSPRMLGNVRELVRRAGIHVVGVPSPPEACAQDLIEIRDPATGALQAVVAAVPFLPDRFVRSSLSGQGLADREAALTAGIHAHFARLNQACQALDASVPRIATGHLYATGSQAREGQDNIYVGNVRNLNANDLPTDFAYVALGHIHRPQALPGVDHVRYSGSLIALDFQETSDVKGVWEVELGVEDQAQVSWHASPVSRRLKHLSGSHEEVLTQLTAFGERHHADELSAWVEVQLTAGASDERVREALRDCAKAHNLQLLRILRKRSGQSASAAQQEVPEALSELSVEEVFSRRLDAADLSAESQQRVAGLFRGVLADARAGKTEATA